ncbi:MAG: DEAD/DEAH box helicase [Rhodococcus sp.]|nr:DEAD/DEAH box helicase [Rhodococcus sp. (in: high G+C Gram-positive bacteria)]
MLHGLWTLDSGLMLWQDTEDTASGSGGPRPVSTQPGAVIDPVERVLERKFRHRVHVPVPVGEGVQTEEHRATAMDPRTAAAFLLSMQPRDARIAGDLHYLVHVVHGIDRWVRAGRIAPELHRTDSQWWPRWQLVGGQRQRGWLAELVVAMPPVLRHHAEASGPSVTARTLLEHLLAELTDPLARRAIGFPTVESPFVAALVAGEPLAVGNAQLSEGLTAWRESLTVDEPQLVLRLLEPEDSPDPSANLDEILWRLEVCLRADGDAPQPVSLRGNDAGRLQLGVRKLADAVAAYPRLRDVPSDSESLDLLLPTPVVTDLVAHGAHALGERGISVLLPRAWSVVSPSLKLRVSPATSATADNRAVGKDQLVDFHWELALGDITLTPDELAAMVAAKSDLVRLRGQWVQADAQVLARAARYVEQRHSSGDRAIVDLLKDLIVDDARNLPIDEIAATGWTRTLLDANATPEPVVLPDTIDAELRPYQQRGVDWLAFMSRAGLGAILADDMGLGKTLQVLALLAYENHDAPTLLACPMSVVGNWQREAARFTPTLRVLVHHGPDRLHGDEFTEAVQSADLVITTYALLARDVAELKEQRWRRIVLDEAQHIKNAATSQARAARAIDAQHRLALTGTPVENRLDELRSILDFTNRGLVGSPSLFRKRFAIPIEREHDADAVARLRTVTSPFILRRVKTDPTVISDLPDKLEMTVRANLTAEQAALYKAVVQQMLEDIKGESGISRKGAVLAALTKLKQVCNHPAHFLRDGSSVLRRGHHRSGKLGLIEDVVDSVLADDEKVLLFTQFREFGDLVSPYLSDRFGVDVPFLHGGVSKGRRDRMVENFQSPQGPPIMVLSLKAGGTGLNLTAANHVVHMDRWWNPAVENQATDRAFRIGQRKNVQVRKLVCIGTLEERIDTMIASKRELADLAVGTGENWVTEMSTEELGELLRLSDEAVGE